MCLYSWTELWHIHHLSRASFTIHYTIIVWLTSILPFSLPSFHVGKGFEFFKQIQNIFPKTHFVMSRDYRMQNDAIERRFIFKTSLSLWLKCNNNLYLNSCDWNECLFIHIFFRIKTASWILLNFPFSVSIH